MCHGFWVNQLTAAALLSSLAWRLTRPTCALQILGLRLFMLDLLDNRQHAQLRPRGLAGVVGILCFRAALLRAGPEC